MEVTIRLQKAGKSANKRYNYRVVAISRSRSREGKRLELIGYYDPSKQPLFLSLNQEKLNRWLKQGAKMSDTVKSLLKIVQKQQKS